jgi:hypothetical protein
LSSLCSEKINPTLGAAGSVREFATNWRWGGNGGTKFGTTV